MRRGGRKEGGGEWRGASVSDHVGDAIWTITLIIMASTDCDGFLYMIVMSCACMDVGELHRC